MSISRSSLDSIPTSFATVSVGKPDDHLEDKLKAISTTGFQGIELGFPDLQSFASKFHKKEIAENDWENLCSAGKEVKSLAAKYNLKIMMLQPFSNFEGWEKGSKEREDTFARAKGWIKIMHAVGTDMLQVGSSDSPNISHDPQALASDLAELADLLSKSSFRLAYENWCWATNSPTWSSVYEIIKLANRPNIGLCFDTFQTFGSEYADPRTDSGLIEHPDISLQKLEESFKDSLTRLTKEVDKDKIYLLQISDAYIPPAPLQDDEAGKEGGLRARGKWSHDFRPYPFNGGAFSAQCVEMVKAVLATGCREGTWFSVEVFDGGETGEGKSVNMESFCRGAMESYRRLLDECASDS